MLTRQPKGQSRTKHEHRRKQTHTHKKKKTRESNLCNIDNNTNLITPTILRWEKDYTHTFIFHIIYLLVGKDQWKIWLRETYSFVTTASVTLQTILAAEAHLSEGQSLLQRQTPNQEILWWSNWKSCYDRPSVGQSVSVSSPIWGPRPDSCYCQTVAVLLMSDTHSDERTDPSSTAVIVVHVICSHRSTYRNSTVSCQQLGALWIPTIYSSTCNSTIYTYVCAVCVSTVYDGSVTLGLAQQILS